MFCEPCVWIIAQGARHKIIGLGFKANDIQSFRLSGALHSKIPGLILTFLSIPISRGGGTTSIAALICGPLAARLSNLCSTTNQSGVLQRIMGFLTNWWWKLNLGPGDCGWVVVVPISQIWVVSVEIESILVVVRPDVEFDRSVSSWWLSFCPFDRNL